MPEGDAVYRDARRLRPKLVDRTILSILSRWPRVVQGLEGATITSVESHGKQLLIHTDAGIVLRAHRQMTGFWRDGPRRRDADLRLGIETDAGFVGLYNAPTVERVDVRALPDHPILSRLGPDVLADDFDPAEAVSRVPPGMAVGLALLDQTIAAGIGNVYRAETLFFERTDPFIPIERVEEPERLWARGRALMLPNLDHGGPAIRTRQGVPHNWVYGRARQPCLRCGRRVKVARQGGLGREDREQLERKVYWCPVCQPER